MLHQAAWYLFFLFYVTSNPSGKNADAVNKRLCFQPNQFDVVIDEIMADPSPTVGLPANEWIELRNTSSLPVDLSGWRIGDASGLSAPFPSITLSPGSVIIVCAPASVNAMLAFGKVIGVNQFPSLNNSGELLYLVSPDNKIIHAIQYSDRWYIDEVKKEGGWSLEMVDTKNACGSMSNWKASLDQRGGSPCNINSVDGVNPDTQAPRLLRAYPVTNNVLTLVFDQPLDSASASQKSSYMVSDGPGVFAVQPVPPLFDRVRIQVNMPLSSGKIYTITAHGLTDCAGNAIGAKNSVRLALPEIVDTPGIVLNEILFNPLPSGADFVEIYHAGKKVFNLQDLSIATRNSAGVVSNVSQLTNEPYLLFPGDFVVLTTNIVGVKAHYILKEQDAFVELAFMPAFNNDKGTVIILDKQGRIFDELTYSEKWHAPLIDKKQGVSLERLNYTAATQSAGNWHSAATSVGYATPTYKNSQSGMEAAMQGTVTVSPEIISPDNDGRDDFAAINYQFPEPGYMANISIFDAQGRLVRQVVKSGLCGISGNFRWDGLGEKSQRLATGVYVVLAEVFNLTGNTKQFKLPVVVARLGL